VNGSTLFLVVATNTVVALAIATVVKGGLIALAKTLASIKSEQAKIRVIMATQENRINELVKKVSVLHMVVVSGHEPRIQNLELKTKDQGPKAY